MLNTLNVSQSGLNAAKVAVENVSNNIANENTPGYKKRVVQLSELEQTDSRVTGRGVDSGSAYRITSQYTYDKLLSEESKQNNYEELSTMLGSIESIFSETEQSGFSSELNRYFQAIEDLRSNPNSEVYKTTLRNEGNFLVESLQNIYEAIEKQQSLEKEELYDNVDVVNGILQDIGSLNEKLGSYTVASNDLLDKRDQLEKELAKYVDIDVSRENGDYELKIAGVTAVRFNINVREVSVQEENTSQIDRFVAGDAVSSNVVFSSDGFSANDVITYKINNEHEVSVTYGESVTTDWNNDGSETTQTVDASNYVRALAHKINTSTDTAALVKAYNGNPENPQNPDQDKFLVIESKFEGTDGKFEGYLAVYEPDSTNVERNSFYKDEYQSTEPESRVFISIYEKEVSLKSGVLKAQTDNLTSDSSGNFIQDYKDKLDAFAQTFVDLTDKYIKVDDEYTYGEASSDTVDNQSITSIGLFSGSSVSTLKFNENIVTDLDQEKLDYLATLQWKKDISFTGGPQDSSNDEISSFSEFFQDVKVNVASDKENNDFLYETQKEVQNSLQNAYDQLVKVDKDEEMVNLIKFQAAYTANAKIITAIDEMLQVLLGLKR